MVAAGTGFAFSVIKTELDGEMRSALFVAAALCVVMGALFLVMARGLLQLRPWARSVATVVSCFGLLGVPIGTLLHGYILYLLHSEKGDRIFQDDYPRIIAATPTAKVTTSPVAWVALALLIVGIGAAVLLAVQRE